MFFRKLIQKIKERILRPFKEMEKRTASRIASRADRKTVTQLFMESAWLQYRQMHLTRLAELRKKAASGKKIRVFFLVAYSAKFESKSVYDAMEKSELFEPTIFIVHPRDRYFDESPADLEDARTNYEIFRQRGYRCIFGYDEYGNPLLLDRFRPDIVFYNNPNLWMFGHYNNMTINSSYLTCYMPYFMDTTDITKPDRFEYRCNRTAINTAWICFEENYYSYYGMTHTIVKEAHPAASLWSGANAVLSGYPKLDAYYEPEDLSLLPPKLRNGKPIVIYAPHWSIRYYINLSTFHLFGDKMLQYAKEHPEINFVFKPHPELADHIRDLNGVGIRDLTASKGDFEMTPEDYADYIRQWEALPNGVYVMDGEYIELFRQSSVLVTDCGSFIQEYLPSGHPCVYIINPEKKDPLAFYGEVGLKILDSYYCCQSWEEIADYMHQILVEHVDEKKQQREAILKSDFVNLGHAGQYICDYLTWQLKDE